MGQYRQETKILAFAIIVIMINILILHKTFSGLERENTVDHGGTHLFPRFKDHINRYNIFDGRFRKLTEVTQNGRSLDDAEYSLIVHSTALDCGAIHKMKNYKFLAAGWTKAVFSADFGNMSYAVKTLNYEGKDVASCLESGYSYGACLQQSTKKILKEISLLQQLSHPNMIKVFGFCVHEDNSQISMVTELGEPLEIIKLLQLSWEERLKIAFDITCLLYYMAHHEHGSIAINDFRRQQFVKVKDDIKLSDVDDLGFSDPFCNTNEDCSIVFPSVNFSYSLRCVKSRCDGYNEKRNIFNGGRHFTTFLLPHGAPTQLTSLTKEIVEGYSNLTLNTHQLMVLMNKIVQLYRNGSYLDRGKTAYHNVQASYHTLPNQDLSGDNDYICMTGTGCLVSVFDLKEAVDICNADNSCKAFVVTGKTSWTGRMLVRFKSGIASLKYNPMTTLYVKKADDVL